VCVSLSGASVCACFWVVGGFSFTVLACLCLVLGVFVGGGGGGGWGGGGTGPPCPPPLYPPLDSSSLPVSSSIWSSISRISDVNLPANMLDVLTHPHNIEDHHHKWSALFLLVPLRATGVQYL